MNTSQLAHLCRPDCSAAPVPRTLSRAHTLRPWLFVRYCFLRLSWNGRYGMYYKYIWIHDKLTVTWLWSGVWYLVWLPNNWGCNWHHKGELSTLLYRQGIHEKANIISTVCWRDGDAVRRWWSTSSEESVLTMGEVVSAEMNQFSDTKNIQIEVRRTFAKCPLQ